MACIRPTLLALALAAALPAAAQTNAELLRELQTLRERVGELERRLEPARPPAAGQWGMTPEQAAELSRLTVRTEAIEDSFIAQGLRGLTISGYADIAFLWNQRQHRAGFQFLNRQADGFFYDTSYIGSVNLRLVKETDGGTLWTLSLSPNRSPGAVVDGQSIVEEASVSVPLADLQTRLFAGQVPDWSGYEYLQPTLNPLITNNLLFTFTLPTMYTGVGVDLTRGNWQLRTMLANVNETIARARSRAPALVYRVDHTLGEFSGWGFAGLHGRTTNFNLCLDAGCEAFRKSTTHLFEVDGWYARGDLTLGGQIGVGMQREAAIIPAADGSLRDARWWGVSGLVGWNFTPRLQGLLRADYLHNRRHGGGLFTYTGYWPDAGTGGLAGDHRNGIGPDATLGCESSDPALLPAGCERGANRYALSLGLRYLLNEHTTLKAEYRLDGATERVFYDVRSGRFLQRNQLLAASVVVAF